MFNIHLKDNCVEIIKFYRKQYIHHEYEIQKLKEQNKKLKDKIKNLKKEL